MYRICLYSIVKVSFISHIIILSFLIIYPDISLKTAEYFDAKDITIVGVATKDVALLSDDNDMQIRITWNNEEREYMSRRTYNALYDRG
jgi:hypothetical protein